MIYKYMYISHAVWNELVLLTKKNIYLFMYELLILIVTIITPLQGFAKIKHSKWDDIHEGSL